MSDTLPRLMPSQPSEHPTPPAPRAGRRSSARERLGFRDGDKGVHSSRTMMLAELTQALAATPAAATREEFRRHIVTENLLGKRTEINRIRADGYLHQLYGLDPTIPIYRLLRRFWEADPEGRPLLAMLCACARDPLLRAAAAGVLAVPVGEQVDPTRVVSALSTVSPRFTPKTLASMSRNVGSSFTQSGHLKGKLRKVRVRARATPTTAAFAAALGWMEGARGQFLLASPWAHLLDVNAAEMLDPLLAAARSGWIDVRAAAGVVEVRMDRLLTPAEMEWCHAQPD